MSVLIALNHAAPIPVGHRVEVTDFADTRPENKRRGFDMTEAWRHPAILDLDTGIRYMNHVHASAAGNGGNAFTPNAYGLVPRSELPIARVWRGTVHGCALVAVEGLPAQHTALEVEPDPV